MKKTNILAFVLLFAATATTDAKNISLERARQVAEQFMAIGQTKGSAGALSLEWDGLEPETRAGLDGGLVQPAPFYAFNIDGGGFVIISGDDRLEPVLAYSTEHSFSHADMPDNIAAWVETTRTSISDIRTGKAQANPAAAALWTESQIKTRSVTGRTPVVLETAQWDQNYPFNNLCPEIDSKKAVTGCAPLAAAILMRYYNYPSIPYGTFPAYKTIYDKEIQAVTPQAYDWTQMPLEYDGSWTEQQIQAVSRLVYDCGVAFQANYSTSETNTYNQKMYSGMMNFMKFSKYAAYLYRSNYRNDEWVSMLMSQIDSNNPIIYMGSNVSNGGHAFVVDGYDAQGFLHINWGWGGTGNGFFAVTAMEYSRDDAAIIGLVPDNSWSNGDVGVLAFLESGSGAIKLANSFTTSKPYLTKNETFSIGLYLGNSGSGTFSNNVSLVQCRQNGTVKSTLASGFINLSPNYITSLNFGSLSITATIEEGDYLAVAYTTPGGQRIIDNTKYARIPLRYSLASQISLNYDKYHHTITLGGLNGMTCSLNGTNYTFSGSNELTIGTSGLDGTYPLTISNGHESITVNLTF